MKNQEEIWKNIKGYEGIYQISDLGRVKSLERSYTNNHKSKDLILTPGLSTNGYCKVSLYNGIESTHTIHRLVAIHFIENPENKPCVNHKRGIKIDNRANELEWCTHSENSLHALKIGLQVSPWKGKKSYDHCRSKPVLQYTKHNEFIKEYGSGLEAKRCTGINHIACVCLGNRKTAGGFKWKFK